MTALAPFEADVDPRRVPLDVEIVVPVYNEAAQLEERITALRTFLDTSFPFRALVTVVDNASTDDTAEVAAELAADLRGVAAMHLPRKGRGYALRAAWSTSDAPVVAYMDVDLSTSLSALLPLVAPLLSGHRDVAIGSRLARGAHVVRGPKRELISRAYNLLLKLTLRGRFSDAQCGFKALRRDAAQKLLPLVEDNEWFFDTELLVTAERMGLRIGEVPVDWVDDPDSRVDIVSTAADDLRGVWRLLVRRPTGLRRVRSNEVPADQLLRFAGVGVVSTLGYLFLFVAWRPLMGPLGANAVAMAIATLFNTAVHRELSRSTDGQARRGRLLAVAGGLYVVSLGLTTLGLLVAQWLAPSALLPELVGDHRGQPGRRRLPLRRAAGLDLPPGHPRRCRPDGGVIDDGPHARPRRPRRGARSAGAARRPAGRPMRRSAPTAAAWPPAPRRGRVARFVRGKESDAPWVRPALLALLVATAVLYLWDLGASGWANSFYSAAVQAGTKSWKAFFFGSSDSSNFITVDKPPAFLWPMEISARIFGLELVERAGAAGPRGRRHRRPGLPVVRRWFSAQAALLGGLVVALTPVAAMMFRYNNPDALLALAPHRSHSTPPCAASSGPRPSGSSSPERWWDFGFITKMMQAFLILPVMAVVYLLAAPTGWWRRVWQVVVMGVSVLVAGGWWVAAVALTPAADRPYVGGSQNNSILNLIFGYNGFGRLTGNESGSVGGDGSPGACGARPASPGSSTPSSGT